MDRSPISHISSMSLLVSLRLLVWNGVAISIYLVDHQIWNELLTNYCTVHAYIYIYVFQILSPHNFSPQLLCHQELQEWSSRSAWPPACKAHMICSGKIYRINVEQKDVDIEFEISKIIYKSSGGVETGGVEGGSSFLTSSCPVGQYGLQQLK